MTASPAPDPRGAPSAGTLTEWLRACDDRRLAQLLRLRPDLALPAPSDVGALAVRLGVRSSTQRAVDGLDAAALADLERLVLAADENGVVELAAEPDPEALEPLLARALVWGRPGHLHLAPMVREAVGPYPAGLGRPAQRLFTLVPQARLAPVLAHLGLPAVPQPAAGEALAAWLSTVLPAQLADLDPDEREVLGRLAAGPPVGTLRGPGPIGAPIPARPVPTQSAPAQSAPAQSAPAQSDDAGDESDRRRVPAALRLVARGLLAQLDPQRVELPREVGLALRAAGTGAGADAGRSEPPPLQVVQRTPDELDALGATAVLEALRLVDALADSWSAVPPTVLRSGGLGVRDLRRTARELGAEESTVALVAETMFAGGLLNSTHGAQPVFLPTGQYDRWRVREVPARWRTLADGWLTMTRQPSLSGQRGDRDRVITALGPDAERGTVPALRRQVLDLLAELPPGAAPRSPDEVLTRLAWYQPRRAGGQRGPVQALLAEADTLGLTAAGGLPGYARTLLAGSGPAAEHALERALPAPVDHVLVQPDLTVVVPGPPEPALGRELGVVADLESTGGASVYRITEQSVRRALDAGRTAAQLAGFVATRSRTPVPQALEYLIDDVARRHGVLRTGAASSYLRCDDEALLARVVADRGTAALGLRQLAPTVAVSPLAANQVLDRLREAGYAPAAESADGAVVTLDAEPPRAPDRPPPRPTTTRGITESDSQLALLVRRMRDGDTLVTAPSTLHPVAREVPGVTSAATMETLRTAVREDRTIVFGHAAADGRTSTHQLRPISLAAGVLRGYEPGHAGLASYPVHRITALRLVDPEPDDEH